MYRKKLTLAWLCANVVLTYGQGQAKARFKRIPPKIQDFDDDAGLVCELSETIASMPGFICKGQLIFEDDFNYSSIKQGKTWTPEVRFPGEPDYPFNLYRIGEHVRIKDSSLSIKPVKLDTLYGDDFILKKMDLVECTGVLGTSECSREAVGPRILPPIVTGKLTTKNSFNFKYGRVEVRAKMPRGSWIVPEIQLEPVHNKYGAQNYSSGILRVACVKGNLEYSRKLHGGPILCASENLRNNYLKEHMGSKRWSEDFHTYALEWRPDMIRVFVDGKQYGEVKPKTSFADEVNPKVMSSATRWKIGDRLAPFDDLFYITIGLKVGGINEFPDDESKPWSNLSAKAMLNFWNARHEWYPSWLDDSDMLVDYVKVYAL